MAPPNQKRIYIQAKRNYQVPLNRVPTNIAKKLVFDKEIVNHQQVSMDVNEEQMQRICQLLSQKTHYIAAKKEGQQKQRRFRVTVNRKVVMKLGFD